MGSGGIRAIDKHTTSSSTNRSTELHAPMTSDEVKEQKTTNNNNKRNNKTNKQQTKQKIRKIKRINKEK